MVYLFFNRLLCILCTDSNESEIRTQRRRRRRRQSQRKSWYDDGVNIVWSRIACAFSLIPRLSPEMFSIHIFGRIQNTFKCFFRHFFSFRLFVRFVQKITLECTVQVQFDSVFLVLPLLCRNYRSRVRDRDSVREFEQEREKEIFLMGLALIESMRLCHCRGIKLNSFFFYAVAFADIAFGKIAEKCYHSAMIWTHLLHFVASTFLL